MWMNFRHSENTKQRNKFEKPAKPLETFKSWKVIVTDVKGLKCWSMSENQIFIQFGESFEKLNTGLNQVWTR